MKPFFTYLSGAALMAGSLLLASPACAVQVKSQIPYTASSGQLLDLYLPDDWKPGDNRPAAILIHGGSWVSGHRIDEQELGTLLAQNGIVAVAVDYRLAPLYQWPAAGYDVAEGVWWMRNNAKTYGIDPQKIVAIGQSAGGQLAAMLGHIDLADPRTGVGSKVQAVVSMSGPWDLTVPETLEQKIILRLFLRSMNDAAGASPISYVSKNSPPTQVFHGTADTLVPFKNSVAACAAYVAKGASCELIPLEGLGHATPSDKNLIIEPLARFLRKWIATPQN